MKSQKKSPNLIDQRNRTSTKASPIAKAASKAANQTMFREQAKGSPFAKAMERAATADKVANTVKDQVRTTQLDEVMGIPAKKHSRASKFDAKKMRDITQ